MLHNGELKIIYSHLGSNRGFRTDHYETLYESGRVISINVNLQPLDQISSEISQNEGSIFEVS